MSTHNHQEAKNSVPAGRATSKPEPRQATAARLPGRITRIWRVLVSHGCAGPNGRLSPACLSSKEGNHGGFLRTMPGFMYAQLWWVPRSIPVCLITKTGKKPLRTSTLLCPAISAPSGQLFYHQVSAPVNGDGYPSFGDSIGHTDSASTIAWPPGSAFLAAAFERLLPGRPAAAGLIMALCATYQFIRHERF